jgi:hypothetical protein
MVHVVAFVAKFDHLRHVFKDDCFACAAGLFGSIQACFFVGCSIKRAEKDRGALDIRLLLSTCKVSLLTIQGITDRGFSAFFVEKCVFKTKHSFHPDFSRLVETLFGIDRRQHVLVLQTFCTFAHAQTIKITGKVRVGTQTSRVVALATHDGTALHAFATGVLFAVVGAAMNGNVVGALLFTVVHAAW